MKKTQGTASFAITFRKLSLAAETSEQQAQSHLDAAIKAREARFNLVTEHLKAGGKLNEKQLAFLPEPERSFVKVVELTNDGELKKAAVGIQEAVRNAAAATKNAVNRFFGNR